MDELLLEVEQKAAERNHEVVRSIAAQIIVKRYACSYRKAAAKRSALLKKYPVEPSMTEDYGIWRYWRACTRRPSYKTPCWKCALCIQETS